MAIYAGDWSDASGDPFAPDAFARDSHGAQVAQVRTRARGSGSAHLTRNHAARTIAAYWWGKLTWQQRDAWDEWLICHRNTRDPIQFTPPDVNPYFAFSCSNFLRAYDGELPQGPDPIPPTQALHPFETTIASDSTQLITIHIHTIGSTARMRWKEPTAYMIDPRRVNSRYRWKFTRCIFRESLEGYAPNTDFYWNVPAPWPLVVGDRFIGLMRERDGYHYWHAYYKYLFVTA